MNCFVIRHKTTGKLMPARSSTWWDPEKDKSITPRLFVRLVDAKNAKRYWEGGCLSYHVIRSGNIFGENAEVILSYSKEFGTDRKPDDLEILPATLSF